MGPTITLAKNSRIASMAAVRPIVFIVDDDVSVRESLQALVAQAGWMPEVHASAESFLARPHAPQPSCLVLDVGLPGLNGLELQERVAGARMHRRMVFITGRGEIPMAVRAIKAGAVEFLTKPFEPTVLLSAIEHALERSRTALAEESNLDELRDRYRKLSPREQEVMALVVRGRMNKQVGGELGISEITVKAHRGQVMRKMRAKSLPELVTLADRLGIATAGKG